MRETGRKLKQQTLTTFVKHSIGVMCMITMLSLGSSLPTAKAASSSDGLQVFVAPGVISTNGSYTLAVNNPDGSPYNGYLDYDMLYCPIGVIDSTQCTVSNGPWANYQIQNGSITIPIEDVDGNGTKLPDGTYIYRYRTHGSNGKYSNQIGFVVDRSARPVTENTQNNLKYSIPQPVPGAYAVYQDLAPNGAINGYTKVEIEQDICQGNGLTQRITKSTSTAYWGPGTNPQDSTISNFRWCIGPSPTDKNNFIATASQIYKFNQDDVENTSLVDTNYPDPTMGNLSRLGPTTVVSPAIRLAAIPQIPVPQTLLERVRNRHPRLTSEGRVHLNATTSTTTADDLSPYFYSLAPINLFPQNLPSTFVPIVDRVIYYDATGETLDNWHIEVRASTLGGIYEVRYIEWAMRVANLSANSFFSTNPSTSVANWNLIYRWNVLEDWDWNLDGTLNRITQQGNNHAFTTVQPGDLPVDCWNQPGNCESPVNHTLNKLYAYVPDNKPLTISFIDNSGTNVSILQVSADQPCKLSVKNADGSPYDGFLQLYSDTTEPAIWSTPTGYPIYINKGFVELLPSAFNQNVNTILTFKVRQQTLNKSIASDNLPSSPTQPTNESQTFSNRIYLIRTGS